jgi:heme/copper-type cytochrome/quinol oxidase subunit 4
MSKKNKSKAVKKYCEAVDKHNAKQTYATAEECWSYGTIFIPIILAVLITAVATAVAYATSNSLSFASIIVVFIASLFIMGGMYALNWKAYD